MGLTNIDEIESALITVKSGSVVDIKSGGSFKYNGNELADELAAIDGLNATALGYIESITAGTAAASKALVTDASNDISGMRNIGCTGTATLEGVITSGLAGTSAGELDLVAPTAANGKLIVKAVNAGGAFNTTISNGVMGQASVVTIPDPGAATANFVLDAGNQTIAGVKTFSGAVTADGGIVTADTTSMAFGTTNGFTLGTGSSQKLAMYDGLNMILGATTGTMWGTVGGAAGQKQAWWGATPVVQPVLATGAAHTADDIITMLQTLGICRQA